MAQAARFLFDLDFSAPPEPEVTEVVEETPSEPMITVAEHERILADAVARARADAAANALDEHERNIREQCLVQQKAMLDEVGMVYTEVGTLMERLERDATNLAFAFASRFAERLVAQEPKNEILALLHEILAPLRKTPHISIRLNDAIADEIKEAVDQQMEEMGFEGKITIIPDTVIQPGDCEVEWEDGGIGRNLRSAIRQVEQLIEDHFANVPPVEDEDEDEDDMPDSPEASDETDPAAEAAASGDSVAAQAEPETDIDPETDTAMETTAEADQSVAADPDLSEHSADQGAASVTPAALADDQTAQEAETRGDKAAQSSSSAPEEQFEQLPEQEAELAPLSNSADAVGDKE